MADTTEQPTHYDATLYTGEFEAVAPGQSVVGVTEAGKNIAAGLQNRREEAQRVARMGDWPNHEDM